MLVCPSAWVLFSPLLALTACALVAGFGATCTARTSTCDKIGMTFAVVFGVGIPLLAQLLIILRATEVLSSRYVVCATPLLILEVRCCVSLVTMLAHRCTS